MYVLPNFFGATGSFETRLLASFEKNSLKIFAVCFGSKTLFPFLFKQMLVTGEHLVGNPSFLMAFQSSFGFPIFSFKLLSTNSFFFLFIVFVTSFLIL